MKISQGFWGLLTCALLILACAPQHAPKADPKGDANDRDSFELAQLPPPPVRFVSFGDFGTGSQTQYRVAQAIAKKCQQAGCDFAITLGDNIYNDGVKSVDDPQFQSKFEKPFAPLDFRFYMVLGNHDYRGSVQAQVAYTQRSSKWYLPSRYYDFEVGPVHFMALDTNLPDKAQRDWVLSRLKAVKAPWRIVYGHHPRFSNSVYKNTQSAELKSLLDSFCGQAQLYLAGHEHDKQVLKPNCGILHVIAGTGAGQRTPGKGPNTLFSGNSLGFSWIEVTPQHLRLEVLNTQGQIEYQYRLKAEP